MWCATPLFYLYLPDLHLFTLNNYQCKLNLKKRVIVWRVPAFTLARANLATP